MKFSYWSKKEIFNTDSNDKKILLPYFILNISFWMSKLSNLLYIELSNRVI